LSTTNSESEPSAEKLKADRLKKAWAETWRIELDTRDRLYRGNPADSTTESISGPVSHSPHMQHFAGG
jgi:hypothetical protein